jgi:hypothetical protein
MVPPLTWIVGAVLVPAVILPVFWPTMVSEVDVHVMFPVTEPWMTTKSLPVGTELVGKLPLDEVKTRVSALEAQWPSVMHTPGPIPEHSLSAVQAWQAFVVVLQMGAVPEQVELSVHCTQAPVLEHAACETSKVLH